jgi:aminopeptidase N
VDHGTADGWSSWHWRIADPITTYMAFFAAGQYRLERGTAEGRRYVYAVSERLNRAEQRTAMHRLRMTDDLVAWLQSVLGDYPFDEIGGVIPGVPAGYALEDATRPVYPWYPGTRAYWARLMVHELAHQWFGDDVAVRRWQDVWLNEGFATYMEWWYGETHGGRTVAEHLHDEYGSIPAGEGFWQVKVSDPGPDRMWSNPVYLRGAMMLAALRTRIGDYDFTELLHQWLAAHHQDHGTGAEFRTLADQVSGEDLAGFFQHWLDDTSKPEATADNGLG